MIVHIADNYCLGWGWLLWPIILGLFTGTFCNRKTKPILMTLGLVFHAALVLVHAFN